MPAEQRSATVPAPIKLARPASPAAAGVAGIHIHRQLNDLVLDSLQSDFIQLRVEVSLTSYRALLQSRSSTKPHILPPAHLQHLQPELYVYQRRAGAAMYYISFGCPFYECGGELYA